MKKCSNCGNDILDNLIRCPYCGSKQGKKEQDSTEKNIEISIEDGIQNVRKSEKKRVVFQISDS